MIKVAITEGDLLARIDALEPKRRPVAKRWLARAEALTASCVAAGKVGDDDGIWSEIKSVYIEAQNFKCIYCEQAMPESVAGDATSPGGRKVLLEHDVEHFRPKNRVKPWPPVDLKQRRGITYADQLHHGEPNGYVALAFDPLNYAISCKVCNSSYKLDYFPILGTPAAAAGSREVRESTEQPLLLLPLGEHAEDPESLITFLGVFPRPVRKSGPRNFRAKVILDFFELDTRADLIFARAWLLTLLWPRLEDRRIGSEARQAKATAFIDKVVDKASHFPQVACARAFISLYSADRAAAERWYELCEDYLVSKDAAVFGNM